jgi:hypothetical protein
VVTGSVVRSAWLPRLRRRLGFCRLARLTLGPIRHSWGCWRNLLPKEFGHYGYVDDLDFSVWHEVIWIRGSTGQVPHDRHYNPAVGETCCPSRALEMVEMGISRSLFTCTQFCLCFVERVIRFFRKGTLSLLLACDLISSTGIAVLTQNTFANAIANARGATFV